MRRLEGLQMGGAARSYAHTIDIALHELVTALSRRTVIYCTQMPAHPCVVSEVVRACKGLGWRRRTLSALQQEGKGRARSCFFAPPCTVRASWEASDRSSCSILSLLYREARYYQDISTFLLASTAPTDHNKGTTIVISSWACFTFSPQKWTGWHSFPLSPGAYGGPTSRRCAAPLPPSASRSIAITRLLALLLPHHTRHSRSSALPVAFAFLVLDNFQDSPAVKPFGQLVAILREKKGH